MGHSGMFYQLVFANYSAYKTVLELVPVWLTPG